MIKLGAVLLLAVCVSGQAPGSDHTATEYYGLPLGSLHHSSSSTSADVYAADQKTIIITNFVHKPQPGCTTLMAGPKRTQFPESVPSPKGDGILLPVSSREGQRFKRGTNMTASAFFNWPAQFDQLRTGLEPIGNTKKPENAFAGISIDDSKTASREAERRPSPVAIQPKSGEEETVEESAEVNILKPITRATSVPQTGSDDIIVFPATGANGDLIEAEILTATETTTEGPAPTTRTYSFKPTGNRRFSPNTKADDIEDIQPVTARSRSTTRGSTTTTTTGTTEGTTTTQSRANRFSTTTKSTTRTTPKINESGSGAAFNTQHVQPRTDIGRGMLMAEEISGAHAPTNVHPNFFGPLPRRPSNQVRGNTDLVANEQGGLRADASNENGYTIAFGVEAPTPVPTVRPRYNPRGASPPAFGAPGTSNARPNSFDGSAVFVLGGGDVDLARSIAAGPDEPDTGRTSTGVPSTGWAFAEESTTFAGQEVRSTTEEPSIEERQHMFETVEPPVNPCEGKEWCMVEDPRAERRQDRVTLEPDFYHETTPSVLPTANPSNGANVEYRLTEMTGGDLVVYFPDNANVNEFEWFGVYDHCRDTRTAFVNTRDIVPPQETYVDGLTGYDHHVSSGPLAILNCNTIMITDFTYEPTPNEHAVIVVGIGDFPRNVVQQTRAYIVGESNDTPLRGYLNEDLLIRLPVGWKTFDINFISIFNADERVSYGHSIIPPVIVPPCNADLQDGLDVFA